MFDVIPPSFLPLIRSTQRRVFDWNTGDDARSTTSFAVDAGDTLHAAVTYRPFDNSYDMWFASEAVGSTRGMDPGASRL